MWELLVLHRCHWQFALASRPALTIRSGNVDLQNQYNERHCQSRGPEIAAHTIHSTWKREGFGGQRRDCPGQKSSSSPQSAARPPAVRVRINFMPANPFKSSITINQTPDIPNPKPKPKLNVPQSLQLLFQSKPWNGRRLLHVVEPAYYGNSWNCSANVDMRTAFACP